MDRNLMRSHQMLNYSMFGTNPAARKKSEPSRITKPPPRGIVQKGFFYICVLRGATGDVDENGLTLQPVSFALSTRVQIPNLPPLVLPVEPGEILLARVSHFVSPARCFVQLENNVHTIMAISQRVQAVCQKRNRNVCNPEAGTMIFAKYSGDNCFYRASVVSKIGMDTLAVYFVDYGNLEEVDTTDVYALADKPLLAVPPQAVHIKLDGVNDDSALIREKQLVELLNDQTVGVRIISVAGNNELFLAKLIVRDAKRREIDIADIIHGERPIPAMPEPQPVIYDPSVADIDDSGEEWHRAEGVADSGEEHRSGNFGASSNRVNLDGRNFHNDGRNEKQSWSYHQERDDRSSVDYSHGRSGRENRFNGKWGEKHSIENPSYGAGTWSGRSYGGDGNTGRSYGGDGKTARRNDGFGGVSRTCYNCGQPGHMSRDCPEPKKGGRSGGFGNRGGDRDRDNDRNGWKESHRDVSFGRQRRSIDDERVGVVEQNGWKSGNWTTAGSPVKMGSSNELSVTESKNDVWSNDVNDGWGKSSDSIDVMHGFTASGNENDNLSSSTKTNACIVKEGDDDGWSFAGANVNTDQRTTEGEQVESKRISKIECGCLGDIKFGDVVFGTRSDGEEMADPFSFHIQLSRDMEAVERLKLSDLPERLPKLTTFEEGRVCMARRQNYYCRARIISSGRGNRSNVLFIDFGNTEEIEHDELYFIDPSLPDVFYTAEQKSFACRLADIMPVGGMHKYSKEAMKLFSDLSAGEQTMQIRFVYETVNNVYEVVLGMADGTSVSEVLCSRGLAVPFKWGLGPNLTFYETVGIVRSDDTEHVTPVFTVQLADNEEVIDKLVASTTITKRKVNNVRVGDIVLAYFEEDLYRAEVLGIVKDSDAALYQLRFVDYGNESSQKQDELYAFDRDEQTEIAIFTPRQGLQCKLEGVEPVGEKHSWSPEALSFLDKILDGEKTSSALFGSVGDSAVFPVKITMKKEELSDEWTNGSEKSGNGDVDLADWLILKGFAKVENSWPKYPPTDLFVNGERKVDLSVLVIDGQTIYARPTGFNNLYEKMNEALRNVATFPCNGDCAVGLIDVDGILKRAVTLPEVMDETTGYGKEEERSCKLFLVDEGVTVRRNSSDLVGMSGLCGEYGFLVRTCHELCVGFKFHNALLTPSAADVILACTKNTTVKALLFGRSPNGDCYIVDDMIAEGKSMMDMLLAGKVATLVNTKDEIGAESNFTRTDGLYTTSLCDETSSTEKSAGSPGDFTTSTSSYDPSPTIKPSDTAAVVDFETSYPAETHGEGESSSSANSVYESSAEAKKDFFAM